MTTLRFFLAMVRQGSIWVLGLIAGVSLLSIAIYWLKTYHPHVMHLLFCGLFVVALSFIVGVLIQDYKNGQLS